MVVHGQLVEPAVCLSDLYDVFLLDIVRDTRQNLWIMIYRSQSGLEESSGLPVLDRFLKLKTDLFLHKKLKIGSIKLCIFKILQYTD